MTQLSDNQQFSSSDMQHNLAKHGPLGLTWRCVILTLVLIPLNVYWVTQMEMMRYSAHPTTVSLFFNAVFILLILVAANHLVRRISTRHALTQPELLMSYSMICIASCVCGHDGIQVLMPIFSWSFRMATPENKWDTLINPLMPKWLTVQDPDVLKGFYEGGSSLYRPEVISAWMGPCILWTLFIIALMMVMLGLNVLLRKQWLEGEHLACPLVSLPVDISDPKPKIFWQPLFWVGFAIAAGIDTYNSFAFLYPIIPKVPIDWVDMGPNFVGSPWNAVGWFPRSFYPFVIGIGYLMPTDFLFSCWFFYLFWKVEAVLSAAFGWNRIPEFPFANYQAFGTYMLFGVHALIIGRGYIKQVWARIIGDPKAPAEHQEAMSYRIAFGFIIVGFVFLVWFSAIAGLNPLLAIVFFIIYFALAISVNRMRAQFGAPVHDLHFTGPDQILTSAIGTQAFGQKDLIVLSMYWWFNRAYRAHPMPHQLEAMKMQSRSGASAIGTGHAVLLATIVSAVATFWISLHMYYNLGAMAKGRMFAGESFTKLSFWIQAPQGTNWYAMGAIAVGTVFGLFLQVMRMRYMWWPFHPLGFAISGNWEMNLVWMPLMIAWVLKTSIIKWLGDRAFQKGVPIFMGLILGQFVVGSILNIVSIALHIPSYMFWQ